jgi:DNA transposition AAA+ family ATPase
MNGEQADNIGPDQEQPGQDTARRAMDALNEQNRELLEARMLPAHAQLTEDQVGHIVERFKSYTTEHNIKAAQVAREIKYSPVVVSQWGSGTYKGNVTNVTQAINNWMERDARRRLARRPSDYVRTRVAEDVRTYCYLADRHKCNAVIVAPAGTGKTKVLKIVAEETRGVYVACTEKMRLYGLYLILAQALGWGRNRGSSHELEQFIIEQLKGTGRMVLIDEAHLIGPDIRAVRSIHDGAGVPIVLVGTDAIENATDDSAHGRGQFSSRTIFYNALDHAYNSESPDGSAEAKDLFTEEEIREFFASKKIRLDRDGFKMLWALSCLPGHGCLRLVERIVQVAFSLAPEAEKLTRDDLLPALEMVASRRFVLLQRLAKRQMERWTEPAVAAAG